MDKESLELFLDKLFTDNIDKKIIKIIIENKENHDNILDSLLKYFKTEGVENDKICF
jgi:hypothetical protein